MDLLWEAVGPCFLRMGGGGGGGGGGVRICTRISKETYSHLCFPCVCLGVSGPPSFSSGSAYANLSVTPNIN